MTAPVAISLFGDDAPAPAVPAAPVIALRDYQQDAIDAVRRDYNAGIRRLLVTMPTGTGKGVLIGEMPKHLGLWPALIIVDREELIDQNRRHIERSNPQATTSIEKAEQRADLTSDCVLASAPTWMRAVDTNERLRRFAPHHFQLIISDEAHHDASPRRAAILRYFKPSLLCALTATPFRGDGKPLARIYDKISYSMGTDEDPLGLERCMTAGWLCRVRAKRVRSSVDISNVKTRADDFNQEDLAKAINTDFRNSVVISAIEQHATDRRAILVTCVNKAHAEALAFQLTERGHQAAAVLDHTPSDQRAALFQAFRAGDHRILTGVGVFAEGTDLPIADCLVFARPVKSPLLFTQLVGRVLRPFPDKEYALILDIADIVGTHRICSIASLFGVRDYDALGGDVMELAQKAKKVSALGLELPEGADAETIDLFAERAERIAQGTIIVDTVAEAADLFSSVSFAEEVERDSQFAWVKVANRRYQMSLPGERRVATLWEDALGTWQYTNGLRTIPLGTREKGAPFRDADKCIRQDCTNNAWRAIENGARWRNDPATPKQIELLRKFGIRALPPDLTKGAAAHLMDILILSSKNRRSTT